MTKKKKEKSSSYRIHTQLSTEEVNYLKSHLPNVMFNLLQNSAKRSNTDHNIVNAEREMVRQHLFSTANPNNIKGVVLMIGAVSVR